MGAEQGKHAQGEGSNPHEGSSAPRQGDGQGSTSPTAAKDSPPGHQRTHSDSSAHSGSDTGDDKYNTAPITPTRSHTDGQGPVSSNITDQKPSDTPEGDLIREHLRQARVATSAVHPRHRRVHTGTSPHASTSPITPRTHGSRQGNRRRSLPALSMSAAKAAHRAAMRDRQRAKGRDGGSETSQDDGPRRDRRRGRRVSHSHSTTELSSLADGKSKRPYGSALGAGSGHASPLGSNTPTTMSQNNSVDGAPGSDDESGMSDSDMEESSSLATSEDGSKSSGVKRESRNRTRDTDGSGSIKRQSQPLTQEILNANLSESDHDDSDTESDVSAVFSTRTDHDELRLSMSGNTSLVGRSSHRGSLAGSVMSSRPTTPNYNPYFAPAFHAADMPEPTHASILKSINFPVRSIEDFQTQYDIGVELGSGCSALVHEVKMRTAPFTCRAAKLLQKDLIPNPRFLANEIRIQHALEHPNAVRLFDVYETPTHLILVMELAAGGELFDRIIQKGSFTEEEACVVMCSLAEVVACMHSRDILHRDLKPENVLFASTEEDAVVKLADFGFSIWAQDPHLSLDCGTGEYVAPEVLRREEYTTASDVWSFGVILYIILCGFHPFYDPDRSQFMRNILAGDYTFPSPEWDTVSDSAKDLIRRLLVQNPKDRLTAQQALFHPWMRKGQRDFNMPPSSTTASPSAPILSTSFTSSPLSSPLLVPTQPPQVPPADLNASDPAKPTQGDVEGGGRGGEKKDGGEEQPEQQSSVVRNMKAYTARRKKQRLTIRQQTFFAMKDLIAAMGETALLTSSSKQKNRSQSNLFDNYVNHAISMAVFGVDDEHEAEHDEMLESLRGPAQASTAQTSEAEVPPPSQDSAASPGIAATGDISRDSDTDIAEIQSTIAEALDPSHPPQGILDESIVTTDDDGDSASESAVTSGSAREA